MQKNTSYFWGYCVLISFISETVSSVQVRIFPYLIGRESAFADNLKWMACANKGLWHFGDILKTAPYQSWVDPVYNFPWCVVYVMCGCMWMFWLPLFLPKGNEVALGGVRGQSALIPLPVRVCPPQLRTPDGSHVSVLRMSALWKPKSQPGKHNTEGLWGDPHPPPPLPHTGSSCNSLMCLIWNTVTASQTASVSLRTTVQCTAIYYPSTAGNWLFTLKENYA